MNTTKNAAAYKRVSDPKQGEGVSLTAQENAISEYAKKNNLNIIRWFEEIETAAKQGRPAFLEMLKFAKKRKVKAIIIHKIDRGARNLEDWLKLVQLSDNLGIEIHFAHESIDMNTRGGRLSADIQAVIAADYIRNLRQETIKGLYGRLNQGIYPFQAPVGYLDMGKGKLKVIDEKKAPLVKQILEKYSTGLYTQVDMVKEANEIELTNLMGRKMTKNSISRLLSNPFYAGLMKVKGQIFKGIHEPIITMSVYEKNQDVLSGKTHTKVTKHQYLFRKLFKCCHCSYTLIGEKQKGNIYYRCHTKGCPTKGLREDYMEERLIELFNNIELDESEKASFLEVIHTETLHEEQSIKQLQNTINLNKEKTEEKLDNLIDALIDGIINKEMYEKRKFKILAELQKADDKLNSLEEKKTSFTQNLDKFLELTKSLKNIYILGNQIEKRELLEKVTSNLLVENKKLLISMKYPFQEIARLGLVLFSAPNPTEPRTNTKQITIKKIRGIEYFVIDLNTSIRKERGMNKDEIRDFALKGFEFQLNNLYKYEK